MSGSGYDATDPPGHEPPGRPPGGDPRSAGGADHAVDGFAGLAGLGGLGGTGAVDLGAELDRLLERGRDADATPEDVQRGLASLVLTIVELLRELMERQALRRMEAGTLTDEEIERLGATFLALRQRMDELKDVFGLTDEDLNLDLGPLGRLR